MQLGPWVLPSIQHDFVSVYDYSGPNVLKLFYVHKSRNFILDTHWRNLVLCVHKSKNCCMLSHTCIESITSTPK